MVNVTVLFQYEARSTVLNGTKARDTGRGQTRKERIAVVDV